MRDAKPEIVVQADLGGISIAFTSPVDELTEAGANAVLDLAMKAVGRQRAKISLTEKMVDLLAHQKALASWEDRRREMLLNHEAEKARQIAALRSAHEFSGKRGDFKLTDAQVKGIDQYDAQTQDAVKKLENEKEAHLREIPVIEAQISRLRAVVAGREMNEPLEDEIAGPLVEAAE